MGGVTLAPPPGQPLDADLTTFAGLVPAQGDILIRGATAWELLLHAGAAATDVLKAGASQPAWGAPTGGGSVATDTIWDAAGDLAVGTGPDAAARLAMGTALQTLRVNAGATALEWGTPGAPGADSVTNAILANVPTATIKGRITAGTGDPEDLTPAQALTVLGIDLAQLATLNTVQSISAAKTFIAASAAAIPVTVRGFAAQTANLQEWQDSTSAVQTKVMGAGYLATKLFYVGSLTEAEAMTDGAIRATPRATTGAGIIVRGLASQTADLQQWQDSAGAVLSRINSAGFFAAVDVSVDSTNMVGTGTDAQVVFEELDDAIAANVSAIAGAVLKADYNANTVLAATADNTPLPITMGASTILARLASGDIIASTPTQMRTLLGLVIGTDVQAFSSTLATLASSTAAGLALMDDATNTAQRATLGLVIGTDVQAFSSAAAFRTDKLSVFAATTSAELAGVISNETGTSAGLLVFNDSPTIVTPTIASFANAAHSHQNAAGGATLDHGLALTGLTDDDHTQYMLLAGRSGGQFLTGGTGSGDHLTLISTSHATKGYIKTGSSPLSVYSSAITFTAAPPAAISVSNIYTLNFASAEFGGGVTGTDPGVINLDFTAIAQQSMATIGSIGYFFHPLIKNISSVAADLGNISAVTSKPTYQADSQTITLGPCNDFLSVMNFDTTGGGVLNATTDYVNFEAEINVLDSGVNVSGTYAAFAMKVPNVTGGVLESVTGLRIVSHNKGSVDSTGVYVGALTAAGVNVGVDILAPSGGTTNVGLRNLGTSRQLLAATIGANAAAGTGNMLEIVGGCLAMKAYTMTLANGVNSNVTLPTSSFVVVSGPTGAFSLTGIAGGTDGKVVFLINRTGQVMTITNDATSTPANRILTLTGADQATVGGEGTFLLMYDADLPNAGATPRWLKISAAA